MSTYIDSKGQIHRSKRKNGYSFGALIFPWVMFVVISIIAPLIFHSGQKKIELYIDLNKRDEQEKNSNIKLILENRILKDSNDVLNNSYKILEKKYDALFNRYLYQETYFSDQSTFSIQKQKNLERTNDKIKKSKFKIYTKTKGIVKLKESLSPFSEEITKIPKGEKIRVIGFNEGDWYVEYRDIQGSVNPLDIEVTPKMKRHFK